MLRNGWSNEMKIIPLWRDRCVVRDDPFEVTPFLLESGV